MHSIIVELLVVAAVAVAQDNCTGAPERLRSESPSEKAWAAELAADCRISGLTSEIADQLAAANPQQLASLRWDSEPFWMARAFLDALIRLRAPLGKATLRSIAKGFPTEATILMLQNSSANRALLTEIRDQRPTGREWIAASNALVTMRADGLAASLLHEVKISQTFVVIEAGQGYPSGTAGIGLSGAVTVKLPQGFPPIAFYHLTALKQDGDERISEGATPIYSQRIILYPGAERELTWQTESYCVQCLRITYLSQLASLPHTEVEHAIEPWTSLRWSPHFSSEILRALEAQVAAIKRLAKSLVSSGALKPAEFMPLEIEVWLNDQRTDQSQPLPTIVPLKFNLP